MSLPQSRLRPRVALRAVLVGACVAGLGRVAVGTGADSIGEHCKAYLNGKNFASPAALQAHLKSLGMPCTAPGENVYEPNPAPGVKGATDTSSLSCRYGIPRPANVVPLCCGWKPHFNWVISECSGKDPGGVTPGFCKGLPACAQAPKINYVAAYQFDGEEWVLMDESSAGTLTDDGISGNYASKKGWEEVKKKFLWQSGDWAPKYAPWARDKGIDGPRGATPPGALWIMSADNFYYGGFYMLSQLNINLSGKNQPSNCWTWEFDPVEGSVGWMGGKPLPGSLNMMYGTGNAQQSGCMPLPFTANQAQGVQQNFSFPEYFRDYCAANPDATGCDPWKTKDIWWSGAAPGSQRFENLMDEPYVFAVVVDKKGYWTYRWRPDADGATGWPGVGRHQASRKLQKAPIPVKDPRGLKTDVPGDVHEAVMLQPSSLPEAACLRSSIQGIDPVYGADALGAIANEIGEAGPGGSLEGAQNFWSAFADTGQQDKDYPLSIAGVPTDEIFKNDDCNIAGKFGCACNTGRSGPPSPHNWPKPGPGPGPGPGPAPSPGPNSGLWLIIVFVLLAVGVVGGGVCWKYYKPEQIECCSIVWWTAPARGNLDINVSLHPQTQAVATASMASERSDDRGQPVASLESGTSITSTA